MLLSQLQWVAVIAGLRVLLSGLAVGFVVSGGARSAGPAVGAAAIDTLATDART